MGAIPTLGIALVPRAIARLAFTHPEVHVELHEGSTPALVERVSAGSLDLAVVAERPGGREQDFGSLRPERFIVDPMRVAVAETHRLADRRRVGVDELRDEPWIVGRPTEDGEPIFEAWPSLKSPNVAFAAHGVARAPRTRRGRPRPRADPRPRRADRPLGRRRHRRRRPQHDRDPSGVTVTAADAPPVAAAMVAALRAEAARFAMQRPPGERPPVTRR